MLEAWDSIREGGVVMIALIVLSLILYRSAFGTLFFVKGFSAKGIRDELDVGVSKTELEIVFSQSRREFGELVSRQVAFIGMLAAAAPLLGLLGTVIGMIVTFQAITLFGTGDPKTMAGGISQALITTVLGLTVAIPTVLLHSIVDSRAKGILHVLTEQSAGMVAQHAESSSS